MIWLAWRQFRTQAIVAMGVLAAIAIALAVTGPHLVHSYNTSGIATCTAHNTCSTAVDRAFLDQYRLLQQLRTVLLAVPAIIGIFWGAPLVARELESGTYRLAWTQSVTRIRWLAIKLALIGLASIASAGLFSLMVTWWSSSIDRVAMNRFTTQLFQERGIVPIGYAAFAFALGVTVGMLIRRTVPAMAATLVAFITARIAITGWVRPHLIAPVHRAIALSLESVGYGSTSSAPPTLLPNTQNIPNAWIYSSHIVDKMTGRALTPKYLASTCPQLNLGPPPGGQPNGARVPANVQTTLQDCIAKVGTKFHEVVTYQPANRYWTFQTYETAIFVALALALTGFCFWWIRHHLS
jgi:hypothetical protein